MPLQPTSQDAAEIVLNALGDEPKFIQRFPTGLCHYVFDVVTESGRRLVVRIAEPANLQYLQGAVHWSNTLRPKGVPLPKLIAADVDCRRSAFPYMVLERLPGTDLGNVYADLTATQKQSIASRIVEVQRRMGTLPLGSGFGFATSYKSIPHHNWSEVISGLLDRSAKWIGDVGVVSPAVVDRIRSVALNLEPYFATIQPIPFLDDTTTKNVIVNDGQLSGIVDVDEVCFGDALLTPALTRMALLASEQQTDYTDFWCDALELNDLQRRALTFYTALFCVTFLGEVGQRFNANGPISVEEQKVAKLTVILEQLLDTLIRR